MCYLNRRRWRRVSSSSRGWRWPCSARGRSARPEGERAETCRRWRRRWPRRWETGGSRGPAGSSRATCAALQQCNYMYSLSLSQVVLHYQLSLIQTKLTMYPACFAIEDGKCNNINEYTTHRIITAQPPAVTTLACTNLAWPLCTNPGWPVASLPPPPLCTTTRWHRCSLYCRSKWYYPQLYQ